MDDKDEGIERERVWARQCLQHDRMIIIIYTRIVKKIQSLCRKKSYMLYFDPRPGPKMLFQGDTPEGSDTFQRPVIERDRVGGLRLMIWDKVKVPLCHYSHAPEESNL